MADSSVQVTVGSGTHLRTVSRSYGGTTKHSEYAPIEEPDFATYSFSVRGLSIATSNDHLLQIMAGASLNVRIKRIVISQVSGSTNSLGAFALIRLTSAGTGGTSQTPQALDSSDSAAGATGMTTPTVKGTEGVELGHIYLPIRNTNPTGDRVELIWSAARGWKSPRIPAGTSNGYAIKNLTGIASTSVGIFVEFTETNF